MGDELFTVEVVRDFILAKGGKVTNTELVLHFKPFVNNPNESRRAGNRKKFKDFVNTVANVKLGDSGEKCLVLKKRYSDGGPISSSKSKGFVIQEKGPKIQIQRPKAKIVSPEELRVGHQPPEEPNPSGAILGMAIDFESIAVGRPHDEVFSDKDDMNSSSISDVNSLTSSKECIFESNDENGDMIIDDDQNNNDNFKLDLDDATIGESCTDIPSESRCKLNLYDATIGESSTDLPSEKLFKLNLDDATIHESSTDLPSGNQSKGIMHTRGVTEEHSDTDFQPVQSPEGVEPSDKDNIVKNTNDEVDVTKQPQLSEVDAANDSVVSVRERAKHINRIESKPNLLIPGNTIETREKFKNKTDEDNFGNTNMAISDVERKWMLASAACDYQEMSKLLVNDRYLAKRKDPISGYTPLHWAAKRGNLAVLKLLCTVPGIDFNARTNSGYTPLHLAARFSREEITAILLETYGADNNIRDYSGKLPKHYLRNSGMNASHNPIIRTSIDIPTHHHHQPFRRIPSWSAKIHKGKSTNKFTIDLPSPHHRINSDNGRRSPSPSPFSPIDSNQSRNIGNMMASVLNASASIVPAHKSNVWHSNHSSPRHSPASTPPMRKKSSQGNKGDENVMPPPTNFPFKRKKKSKSGEDLHACSDGEAEKRSNEPLSERKISSSRSMFIIN